MSDSNLYQFKMILGTYKPSQSTVELLQKIPLVIITSATSTGKDSITAELLETNKYSRMVTDTTRPKRVNNGQLEQDRQDYRFLNEQQFLDGLKSGKYIEAAIVHKKYVYGTSVEELQKATLTGKTIVVDIDIVGCDHIKQYASVAKAIFLLPPSFKEWMRRLKHRGTMSEAEQQLRLKSATLEIQGALNKPYFVFFINDDLAATAKQIDDFVATNHLDASHQVKARAMAEQLLTDLKHYLN